MKNDALELDAFNFWNNHKDLSPKLACIAKKLMTTGSSQGSVERAQGELAAQSES